MNTITHGNRRLDPRAKERLRRVSSSGGNEFVSRLTEGPVRTESDRPKADAEPLVLDDLVGAAVLGGGVGVGSGSTNLWCSLKKKKLPRY